MLMKSLLEIIKELIPIIIIAGIAAIGYAIASMFIILDFVGKDGQILWRSVFFGFASLIAGFLIYKVAEKLWAR